MYGLGATYKMIAAACGVTEDVFGKWIKKYPALKEEMHKQRGATNVRVSGALLDQATGYFYTDQEVHKIKTEVGIDIKVVDVKKYVKGTTSAAIHWLKCLQGETWSPTDRVEISNLDSLLSTVINNTRGLPSAEADTEKFRDKYTQH